MIATKSSFRSKTRKSSSSRSASSRATKPAPASRTRSTGRSKALKFEPRFHTQSGTPFDHVEWDKRTAEINDDSGKVIFQQENVEVPRSWSALATKIAVSKYFYGDISNGTDPHQGGRETSIRQLIHRVTRTITDWGKRDGYFADDASAEAFYNDLTWLCLHQHGAFNCPGLVQRRPLPAIRHRQRRRPRQLVLEPPHRRSRARTHAIRIPAGQRLLHPVRRGHHGGHHATSPRARPCFSNTAAAPAPTSPPCARPARNLAAAASRAVRSPSSKSTTRSPTS